MTKSRIELIEKLKHAEETVIDLKNLLCDCDSFYFKGIEIVGIVESGDFNKKYKNENIPVSSLAFRAFIRSQIEAKESVILDLINELTKGMNK